MSSLPILTQKFTITQPQVNRLEFGGRGGGGTKDKNTNNTPKHEKGDIFLLLINRTRKL